MKKFIYFCGMISLCLNMMAQIEEGDDCWIPVIDEQFTGNGRGWDDYFKENTTNPIWCVYCPELSNGSGVTTSNRYQAYQTANCLFNNETFSDDKLRLVASYEGGPQDCNVDYVIPLGYFNCNNPNPHIYYHSGNFQTIQQNCHFGYYEVQCSLPVHKGIHTAFWLWGGNGADYEEIDIMEYSKIDCQQDYYYGYSSGIWYNPNGLGYEAHHNVGKNYVHMPHSSPDIREMHTYGCQWLPDRVLFYQDGVVMKEYTNRDSIPQSKKWLKMGGYAIERDALYTKNENGIEVWDPWIGPDTLVVNYIKYYKLRTDCGTDEYIQTFQQFQQLNSVKRTVTINNPIGFAIPTGTKKTIRATDFIIINGPFEMPNEGSLTLIIQECPNTN